MVGSAFRWLLCRGLGCEEASIADVCSGVPRVGTLRGAEATSVMADLDEVKAVCDSQCGRRIFSAMGSAESR